MISDGCGYNHIDAASLFEFGQTEVQAFERFPVRYAMTTFSATKILTTDEGYDPNKAWKNFDYVAQKCTDSGASITAISTGVKTYNDVLGFDVHQQPLEHIFERVESFGKATGVVSSVRFCESTPAGMIVHNYSKHNLKEIVKEMVQESPLEVIMGCGHPYYNDDGLHVDSSQYEYKYTPTPALSVTSLLIIRIFE